MAKRPGITRQPRNGLLPGPSLDGVLKTPKICRAGSYTLRPELSFLLTGTPAYSDATNMILTEFLLIVILCAARRPAFYNLLAKRMPSGAKAVRQTTGLTGRNIRA